MNLFIEYCLLAFAGHAVHLLKMYGESLKRNEEFVSKLFIVNELSNLISIPLLIYVGDSVGPELYVPSKLGSIIIGTFSSSMLSGVINIKKPKYVP